MSYYSPVLYTGGQGLGTPPTPPPVEVATVQGHQDIPLWVPVVAGGVVVLVVGLFALSVWGNYQAGKAFSPDKEHEQTYAVAGAALGTQYGLPGLALLGIVGVMMHNKDGSKPATAGLPFDLSVVDTVSVLPCNQGILWLHHSALISSPSTRAPSAALTCPGPRPWPTRCPAGPAGCCPPPSWTPPPASP